MSQIGKPSGIALGAVRRAPVPAEGMRRALCRRVLDGAAYCRSGAGAHMAAALALVIRVGSAVLAFASQSVIARFVGPHEFGIFAFAWVWFLVIASVANLGFGDSTLRFVPALRARGESAYMRGFVLFVPCVVAASSMLAALLAVVFVNSAGSSGLDPGYVLPLTLMAVTIPLVSMQSLLEGLGRSFDWIFVALAPNYVFRHGLILAFMGAAILLDFAPADALAFGCVTFAVTVSLIWQGWAVGRRFRAAVDSGPRAYRAREWLAGSIPFAVLQWAGVLFSFADVLVLSFFASPSETAVYFAATRVIQVVNLIPYSARVAGSHRFSAAYARGALDEIQRLASQMALLTFFSSAACLAVLGLAGDSLLRIFGEGFQAGYVALLILGVGILAAMAAGSAEEILNMTGHGQKTAWSFLAFLAVSIVLNIALIIPYGVTGAASATAICMAGRSVWLSFLVRRQLGIRTSVLAALLP